MRTLIIDNHTKNLEELCALFPKAKVTSKENFRQNSNISDFDLIVLSGGSNVPTVLRHPEEYSQEMDLVRNSNIPILGICLGSEIITKAFDGNLVELDEELRGAVTLNIENKTLIETLGSETLKVYEGHKIAIKDLPGTLVSCANSEHGIEIIKHATKPIIGLSFHPEISPNKDLLRWVLKTLHLEPPNKLIPPFQAEQKII